MHSRQYEAAKSEISKVRIQEFKIKYFEWWNQHQELENIQTWDLTQGLSEKLLMKDKREFSRFLHINEIKQNDKIAKDEQAAQAIKKKSCPLKLKK